MSIQAHLDSLAEKHELLETKISEEFARPMPDLVQITNMKKQKLALKEEMQNYSSMLKSKKYNTSS